MDAELPAVCGRCHIMPAATGQAWCVDCTENDNADGYTAGVPLWDAGLDADGQP
ncbi:hypothetical protein [Micromonospora carbonacea]|uniref:hypothetical protein n=1 Tax=Micromonospora carbonacea TaxID=47853 RepID=UPI00371FFE0A